MYLRYFASKIYNGLITLPFASSIGNCVIAIVVPILMYGTIDDTAYKSTVSAIDGAFLTPIFMVSFNVSEKSKVLNLVSKIVRNH